MADTDAAEQLQAIRIAALAAEARAKSARRTLALIIGTVLTSITGTVTTVGWAQSRIDGGVTPVKAQVQKMEENLQRLEQQTHDHFTRLEKKVDDGQYRQDVKLDSLLLHFHVPNPAAVPIRDGGQ